MPREDPVDSGAAVRREASAHGGEVLAERGGRCGAGTVNASEYFISPVVNQSADSSTGTPASRVPSSVETDHAEP